MLSVQANSGPAWPEKNATAFWRGRDSRQERLELVKLSRAHPHMIDAAFTNFFFFKHDESLYGPLVKHVSFFDFFKVSAKSSWFLMYCIQKINLEETRKGLNWSSVNEESL